MITGHADGCFGRLKDVFARSFADHLEYGAQVCVIQNDEIRVNLNGGFADKAGLKPYDDQTLTPVFSTGKAIMALLMSRLVDAGLIDYETPISKILMGFGAGKENLSLGQFLSHQGGLCGLKPPQSADIWFDLPRLMAHLNNQSPLWPVGEASGYHPVSGGFVMNAVHRSLTGKSLGEALRDDFAAPLGLLATIGVTEDEFDRIADMQKPSRSPDLGPLDEVKQAAFFDAGSSPVRTSPMWRKAEIPSANLHANAESLARLMSVVAQNGVVMGKTYLGDTTITQLTRERIRGQDRVLPFRLSWAAGLLRNEGINIYGPNPRTVGHSGWGGSCVIADREKGLSFAYVMNKQSHHLIGDPRPVALINALYECL